MYEVASAAVSATAFEFVHHLVTVPVAVNGIERRFVLDSGIGITLLSEELCAEAGCGRSGATYTGRRMSGQAVKVDLARADSLVFGGLERTEAEVGVLDLSLPPELADVGGFLSLAFFDDAPFTVDYPGRAVVRESAESLAGRETAGTQVDVHIERDGPAVTAFAPLVLPDGRTVSVEIDMGSDALILDERFAGELGVDLEAEGVRRTEGVDETGNNFVRRFTQLEGRIELAGLPQLGHDAPDVMFQRIIHDGLIGHAFLGRFVVTWDLAAGRLLFASPG
jgi:hypothetical protein